MDRNKYLVGIVLISTILIVSIILIIGMSFPKWLLIPVILVLSSLEVFLVIRMVRKTEPIRKGKGILLALTMIGPLIAFLFGLSALIWGRDEVGIFIPILFLVSGLLGFLSFTLIKNDEK